MKTLLLTAVMLLSSLVPAFADNCYFVKVYCVSTNPFLPQPPGAEDGELCEYELKCDPPRPSAPNLPGGPNCPPDCWPFCPLPQPDLGPQTHMKSLPLPAKQERLNTTLEVGL